MRWKLIWAEFRFVPLPEPPLFILRSVTHVKSRLAIHLCSAEVLPQSPPSASMLTKCCGRK